MKILIVGATGMVGQSVLKEALTAADVSEVITLGRTAVLQRHRKLRQITVADLHNAQAELAQLHDIDACFFCIGVTSGGMRESDYRRLTYELTLNTAQALLPANPEMRFVYISGAGADSSEQSKTMWARVRGETENALLRLPFNGVYCLRPAIILPIGVESKTAGYRWFYRLTRPFFPIMRAFSRSVITSRQLAGAMLSLARYGYKSPIIEAKEIRQISEQ